MKENSHLVLLTNGFPFASGEAFIEDEIHFLASSFQKITIISVSNNFSTKRKVPANCEVVEYRSKQSFLKKANLLLAFIIHFRFIIIEIVKELYYVKNIYKRKINFSIISQNLIFILKAFALNKFIQKRAKPAIIYSYWFNQTALATALYKKENKEVVCVSRAHGGDLYFERTAINYIPFHYFKIESLDELFFISENGRRYFQKLTSCDAEKLSISHLGINVPKEISPYSNFQKKTLVSCSFIYSLKRIDLIISSLAQINFMNIKWIHIGDGPLRSDIEEFAKNKLVKKNIEYQFMGNLSHSDVLKFYSETQVDLFINLSSSEGIPVSIMEAMSFGIPALATDVGGTSELVNHTNGILIKSNESINNISKNIEELLTLNTNNIQSMRKNARATVENRFKADINYSRFTKQLLKLLDSQIRK